MNAGNIVDAFVSDSKWNSVPAKRLFTSSKEINQGMKETNRLALTMKGVINRSLDDLQGLQSSDYSVYQIFEKDDLVFKLIDLENIKTSRVGIVHERGIMSPAYIRVSANSNSIYPRFYYWYFFALYLTNIYNKLGGGVRQNLTAGDLLEIPVPLIDISLQKQVSTFLDRETQRIDSLIEEKQTFIKLLKEKRQALISHVVTKGLNPDVEMQDSGIEWIGQVPKHWNITSLKSVSTVVDPNPSHRNPEYVDNGFPFISTKEFTGIDGIELDTLRRVSEDTVIEQEKRCEFRKGSIAFSRKGTIGEVRILPHHIRFALLDSVCVINAGDTVSYQYLYLQAKSSVYDSQLGAVVRGAALKQVSVGKVRDLLTLCPPIDEQNQIVTYIDQQLEKLDKLVVETSTSLSLLKERRISLISAAVTGKIDVREAV
ncbi:type I restriction modification DNA specificity domain protein [Vibrio campbellii]|uniref:restriction endonuclease subunit S n=1 Tax=Vibrio campbellii TaxID=680 RepID=UPI000A2FA191|nr:restriction endonuclease subunit S [Vibrio campbellii]ARR04793.1 type I restriction modification DNA specificity domain protein [Vibrio campbellii]